jgi:membrane protease YdiL (CAAX protease family)
MRAFLWIIVVTVLTLLVTALVAYPAYLLAHGIDASWKFHRIASRVAMLIALVGVIMVARRYRLGGRAALGFALPFSDYLRTAGIYLVAGVASMLPMLALMFATQLRLAQPGVVTDAASFVRLALQAIAAGVAVALIEETFFRGFLHTAVERERGPATAVVAVSLLFGVLHFIGKAHVPGPAFAWSSGFEWLGQTLRLIAHPATIVDSLLAYVAVGAVLGMVRAWMGHTAGCVGLHAGWVAAMLVVRESTTPNGAAPLAFLQGSFDGFVGWLVCGWTVVIGLVFVALKRRRLAFANAIARGIPGAT